eukprot:2255888-Pleurochrysis_carterae.AAC.6
MACAGAGVCACLVVHARARVRAWASVRVHRQREATRLLPPVSSGEVDLTQGGGGKGLQLERLEGAGACGHTREGGVWVPGYMCVWVGECGYLRVRVGECRYLRVRVGEFGYMRVWV